MNECSMAEINSASGALFSTKALAPDFITVSRKSCAGFSVRTTIPIRSEIERAH